jgi:predicted unusual protein kinase regulating ubiquinone biosynthesis (AarF/ABC1/UbiB family)
LIRARNARATSVSAWRRCSPRFRSEARTTRACTRLIPASWSGGGDYDKGGEGGEKSGDDIDNVLIFNNTIPISIGSIAQVYDCTLKSDGRRVAVKIKHPDLEHQIFFPKLLINICLFLLNFFNLTIYIPFNLDNFFDTLYKQLDFNEESKNLHIFKKNFVDSNLIIIPESIYNNYDIIIMSYEEGIFYENIDNTKCNDFHKFKMNFTLFMFVMQCFLIDGINHADLHNGNWKVRFNPELNEYQIIIYDAGVVYHSNIQSMQDLIFAYDSNNIDAFIKILIRDNYILNLNDDNRDMIYNLLHERLVPVIRRPFDFTFIIFEAIDILKTEKFYIDGEFLTIIIGISLVEKHFKKYKIMGDCHHIDENVVALLQIKSLRELQIKKKKVCLLKLKL